MVGNLDHAFGARFWYATEALYPIVLIVLFVLFGKSCFDLGKGEPKLKSLTKAGSTKLRIVALFLAFCVLLGLDDLDDISKAVHSFLSIGRFVGPSFGYLLAMEAIFPLGSIVLLFAFGNVSFARGKGTG